MVHPPHDERLVTTTFLVYIISRCYGDKKPSEVCDFLLTTKSIPPAVVEQLTEAREFFKKKGN